MLCSPRVTGAKMFQIGTYKTVSAVEKNNPNPKGRWGTGARRESPRGNWSEGALSTTDRDSLEAVQHHGERPALLFRSAKSIAVCETPACLLAPCGAGEARLGAGIFSFLPLFFCLNGQPREGKKKKSSVEIDHKRIQL